MKKLFRILLCVFIITLFNNIVYAGPSDFPTPDSFDPSIITMTSTNSF